MSNSPVKTKRARQSIAVSRAANVVMVKVNLVASIEKEIETGLYFVHCPALQVCSQGKTIAEAKKNIVEATQLLIEYCVDEGILNTVLHDRGFLPVNYLTGKPTIKKPRAAKKAPAKSAAKILQVQVPVEVPVMACA